MRKAPNVTTEAQRREVLAVLAELIVEVVGDELELDEPIVMATSFNRDLELESIEFVALAEAVQERFGHDIDFVGWLSDMELDQIIELTVGELVEFIVRCSSTPTQ